MKERIVAHTTGMFARDGVKSVRMDDIAAEMGISKRTIYEIFGDKETLLTDCLEYFHRQTRAHYDSLTRDAPNVIAEHLIIMDAWDKQMDATCNIMDDVRKFYPRIYEQHTQQHARLAAEAIRRKLQQGVEQGLLIPTLDLDLTMTVIGYSIYGVIKSEALTPSNVTQREAFKFIITHFIRGIATLKGIEMIDKKLNNPNK